jgi:hypothetical protein
LSIYVDTSVLVSALTNEPRTSDAQSWLRSQPPGGLMTSDWTLTEFSSAIALKLRTGVIGAATRAAALAACKRLIAQSFELATIPPTAFGAAARFCDHHSSGLRAGDALHLAIAFEHGATLCTFDQRMASGGLAVGASTLLL